MDIFAQLIVNGFIAGSLYALIAVSFSLLYGATRFFHMAHGSFAVIAAYVVVYLHRTLELPFVFSVISGVVLSGLVGYVLFRTIYRPLRERGGSPMILLVASLGVMIVIHSLLAITFSSNFTGLTKVLERTRFELLGASVSSHQIGIFFVSIVVSLLVFVLLEKTMFGKKIQAVSDDEEVARVMGINANAVLSSVFFLSAALAGLGGILTGVDTGVQPSMDLFFLLKAVIAAIIGGVGNVYGAFFAAFLVGIVENLGIWFIPSEWKDSIAFGLLILFLLVRPNGLLGKR